jgi:hypothetical protein
MKRNRARDKAVSSRLREEQPFVAREGYFMADCPTHGRTAHLTYLGNRCEECQKERLA